MATDMLSAQQVGLNMASNLLGVSSTDIVHLNSLVYIAPSSSQWVNLSGLSLVASNLGNEKTRPDQTLKH